MQVDGAPVTGAEVVVDRGDAHGPLGDQALQAAGDRALVFTDRPSDLTPRRARADLEGGDQPAVQNVH
ncbi:hypothetical protein GCM10010149_72210 [Nonomuraea roseoviolacea subsp. roseoviolacea]